MLEYNEIKPGKHIVYEGEPYEVLESHVARTQQRKPQNQTKLKNLLNGRLVPATFRASERVDEADIGSRAIKFLYSNRGEYWFCEENDPRKRFTLDATLVGEPAKFLKENMLVSVLTFGLPAASNAAQAGEDEEEKIIGVKLPVKVELLVREAPPSIKGDTASGGGKVVTLETGATITAPLFVNAGDLIRVNTETGAYVERVEKR
ncbi:MAG: elongation factor P [bacterium]|nr:elongation factor P [bacterium]